MRCVPQVHGIVNDTVDFVEGIIVTEMNSALDNPVSWHNIHTHGMLHNKLVTVWAQTGTPLAIYLITSLL